MDSPRPELDFSNTERAFAHKSDKELMRSYRLFKQMDSPFLTRIGPSIVTSALSWGLPVTGIIKSTIFDVFCGGESLQETSRRSDSLFKDGVLTMLDYSVEGEKSEQGFDATAKEIIATLIHGAKSPAVAFSAMKVTGIAKFDLLAAKQEGRELSENQVKRLSVGHQRLEEICKKSAELGQPLFIDAEESWIQDLIDLWAEEMMEKYNKEKPVIFTTVQCYRHDRLEYLKGLLSRAKEKGYVAGVKIVRGAYLEKERERAEARSYPDPIQPNKAATDADYDASLKLCVENIDRVAICAGTHNEKSSFLLTELMKAAKLPHDHPHIVFAQLLGMSDNISFNLALSGYNVGKYLPYGPVKAVLPYLFRRANENTAIAGQSSRELELLKREAKRRGLIR